ncbi:MAG: divergent PAP2 family protein, partial [Nanoarchaeota archaeon]
MNKIILSILLAGFGAQLLKLILLWFRHKTLHWRDLVVTGGMPSSHSAFVLALVTIVYLQEGTTTAFAISLVLAFVVLRDAFGVRRSVGEEGLLLTEMLKRLKIKTKTHIALGHTPAQVLVGAVLGFLVAMLVQYFL